MIYSQDPQYTQKIEVVKPYKKSKNPYAKVPMAVTRADAERGIELAKEYLIEKRGDDEILH